MIDEHLAHLRHLGHRPGTIDQRRWCLRRLQDWFGRDLRVATFPELLAFVSRGGPARGPEIRCAEISHLRGFYGWAHEHGHLPTNPASRLRRPRRPKHYPNPMPDTDLARALATAPNPIRQWLYLAAYGGLRCCEIAPLRGEDYLGRQGILIIQEQKGGDTGIVYPGPILVEELVALPARGWWFKRWDGHDAPISAGQLNRHANRWLHDQGITHTMHSARHWYGTHVYRHCKDIRVTMEAMRHLSIASTAGYTFVEGDDVASAVASLPRLETEVA